MASIDITGNADIDQATAEIAVALRAHYSLYGDQSVYNAAMNLRDQIMKGTRELDHQEALARADQGVHPHPVTPFPTPRGWPAPADGR